MQDDLPILYSFRRCPYAMRARLALLASKTACEIREVKLSAKPADMIAASPKATVPVLILSDGRVIDESLDIMRWALCRNDPAKWLQRDDRALIASNDGQFKFHLDRYKYAHRHTSDPAEHRSAAAALLLHIDHRLQAGGFLSGSSPGLTDAAILPFVRQFAETDRGWFDAQHWPALHTWLADALASPAFEAAMIRLEPWKAGDDKLIFGGAVRDRYAI